MVCASAAYAVLAHVAVLLIMVGSGHSILTSVVQSTIVNTKSCPDNRCSCDAVNIICDCKGIVQELIFTKLEKTSVTDIRIKNCNKVTIKYEAVKYLSNLRHFQISNVQDLFLENRSLNWCGARECKEQFYGYDHPSLDITIMNTTISEIKEHVFSERIRELLLQQVKINRLQPYAFTNLKGLKKLEIKDSVLNGIQAQVFKKFYTDYLTIINTKFEALPSRTFIEVEVGVDFKIINSQFDTIKPLGFIIIHPKLVEISGSHFNELEGESFKIETKGPVTIRNNYFNKLQPGAFMGFSNLKESRLTLPELTFTNNTLNELKRDTLEFNRTSFNPKLTNLILNETCTCANIQIWQTNTGYHEEIHCYVPSGRTRLEKSMKAFKTSNCDAVSSNLVLIVSIIVSLLLILLIVGVGLFFLYRRYRQNKQKEYVNRGRNKNGSLGLIVPDGRTYRETELHVIVEKAELLTTEL